MGVREQFFWGNWQQSFMQESFLTKHGRFLRIMFTSKSIEDLLNLNHCVYAKHSENTLIL